MMAVGERANTMARLFNLRQGFTAADDTLPPRLFEPLQNGARAGCSIDREAFRRALQLYYRMAGWDEDGVPTTAKLAELGLTWLVQEDG
jgi:aldehyde:ferredoxin oxidoreductase